MTRKEVMRAALQDAIENRTGLLDAYSHVHDADGDAVRADCEKMIKAYRAALRRLTGTTQTRREINFEKASEGCELLTPQEILKRMAGCDN